MNKANQVLKRLSEDYDVLEPCTKDQFYTAVNTAHGEGSYTSVEDEYGNIDCKRDDLVIASYAKGQEKYLGYIYK
ncbi:hypothetical protein EVB32_190 [Rhizobium phage RHph_TM39]|uniref:Uncharacterized protein n=2 Tax=Cuauhnahuacvirus TaxID=3044696 RepID=A0A7S5UYW1_9CAUD|nr:hypothetical protein PQC16_gp200 [Rhizobium phage RHph_TM30]YP_010671349.1 hypothetical protein PQC17_gp200 [Rhizobium phage RHph_Y65]QIG72033.1 hypothetical protein EVB95_199 [Rhizobium phage RHph_TM2_3B]QIG72396.1 hypothetical protein EVB96_200 [Rhizobium phage RHph_TM3_3_6]QIG77178.1 hypothetical protein EVB32_190 [Rhizobium phage RHph_TM39]QIG71307.1 hypothetical protein EVB93_200 [Rhizobium phage RHph_TM30]QIG72758.1 hypothetical protein EVB97_200 [Rhizobium phage RHph_Y65]